MEIRALADADVDAVIRVWTETKRATYDFIALEQSYSAADDDAFFRAHILPRCAIWVAVEDGAVLGFVALDGSYLDRLYVRPAAQRRGVGAALLARAIEASPAGIELHTHQQNTKARAFYEKMGFVAARFGISPPPGEPARRRVPLAAVSVPARSIRVARLAAVIAIYVDADACPVKDEVYSVAARYDLRVFVVANAPMRIPAGSGRRAGRGRPRLRRRRRLDRDPRARRRRRHHGRHSSRRPLPRERRARARHRRAAVHRGVDRRSARSRALNQELRERGVLGGGPRPLAEKDRSHFASRLDQLVVAGMREHRVAGG